MKVSVLLPGNSANTVCLTSEKGKVARQQQVVRQAGVRGNLQLLCNWSKVASQWRTHVYSLRLSMIHETEQDYKLEICDSQNLAENEEQRNLRLQRLRESRSLEKVNPYEYKRKLNSKDMTDYRSLVTTLLVERQNRLQLLQQNAAMYRENKRLQHLRD